MPTVRVALLAFLAINACLGLSSCQSPPAPPPAVQKPFDLEKTAAAILAYAESLKGLTLDEAQNKLDGAQFRESAWADGGPTGQLLFAAFPDCVFRLYLVDGRVLIASFQVLTK